MKRKFWLSNKFGFGKKDRSRRFAWPADKRSLLDVASLEPQVLLSATGVGAELDFELMHLVDSRDNLLGDLSEGLVFDLSGLSLQLSHDGEDHLPGESGFHIVDDSIAASRVDVDLTVGIATDGGGCDLPVGLEEILQSVCGDPIVDVQGAVESAPTTDHDGDHSPIDLASLQFADAMLRKSVMAAAMGHGEAFAVECHHLGAYLWSGADATIALGFTIAGVFGDCDVVSGETFLEMGLLGYETIGRDREAQADLLAVVHIDCTGVGSTWLAAEDDGADLQFAVLFVDVDFESFDCRLDIDTVDNANHLHDEAASICGRQEAIGSIANCCDLNFDGLGDVCADVVDLDHPLSSQDVLQFKFDAGCVDVERYQVGQISMAAYVDLFTAACAPSEELHSRIDGSDHRV